MTMPQDREAVAEEVTALHEQNLKDAEEAAKAAEAEPAEAEAEVQAAPAAAEPPPAPAG